MEEAAPARLESVLAAFDSIWKSLFSEPVHLDSALAKQSKRLKSTLARIVPLILLRPASQAELFGIGVPEGEPWSLEQNRLARWRPAPLLAERIYGSLSTRVEASEPVRDDFPPHFVEEWEKSFGKDVASRLISELGREAPLSLRASKRVGAKALLASLKKDSQLPVSAELSDLSPLGVRLAGYAPVLGTEQYERGEFEIQDEGSQVMAFFALFPERFAGLLQKTPGPASRKGASWLEAIPSKMPALTVVDACAGAGGKTLAFADALGGRGRVYSYDTSAKKLQALRRRATRAGYNNIQTVTVEEGAEDQVIGKFARRANIVLVDAPCSGWGVLRRNPDIKWRQDRKALERLPGIQARILSAYSTLVAPGGRLVFGVCTFREAETRDIVRGFLAAHPDFVAGPGGYLGPGPCDGFFMQSFERKPG